jgi:hypothetical protein
VHVYSIYPPPPPTTTTTHNHNPPFAFGSHVNVCLMPTCALALVLSRYTRIHAPFARDYSLAQGPNTTVGVSKTKLC